MTKIHYIDEQKNAVWWVEFVGYDMRLCKNIYIVNRGIYLGSYKTHLGDKHIVQINGLTYCVVRHLDKFYKDENTAQLKKIELENNNGN